MSNHMLYQPAAGSHLGCDATLAVLVVVGGQVVAVHVFGWLVKAVTYVPQFVMAVAQESFLELSV